MKRPKGVTDQEWGNLRAQLVWAYAKTVSLKKVKLNSWDKVNRDHTLVHVLKVGKNAKYHEGVKEALDYLDGRIGKVPGGNLKKGNDYKVEDFKALERKVHELENQNAALKAEVKVLKQQCQIEEWFLGNGRILRP